ncbi:hypothetical protein HNR06_000937 [Nocardiopsis arvandica]|uniref:Uncharacterized protein n=1 Tax=Nocardiopsis sinuspersici TaxID=501010 RepID=A0A7Z0BH82_9ACTN|nr:hypothetical protein [Nocardiopsis sinuspersici]NYH51348.1 hypothetical protein [Nocardiopsis sinuspersici]
MKSLRDTAPRFLASVLVGFEQVRWCAAQQGYVLTRQKRLLGAVYALTPLDGRTEILHDLGEVRAFLDRRSS